MMESLYSLFGIAAISLLAAISPGPDFVVVVKNSLSQSRKIGLLTSLGVGLALVIHLSYTLIGIGVLITDNPVVFTAIKYVGAGYLFYIGCKGFISSFKSRSALDFEHPKNPNTISAAQALKQGFLTNLLNPKCALFFVSLFSQFVSAQTPSSLKLGYAAINLSITLGWFLLLSYIITGKRMLTRTKNFRIYIDRVMGCALVLLSIKLIVR